MFDFIADLDGYFCEKYANYDKICVLPDYKMPKMQTSEVREDGRTYAYTLPANTMRLALQEKKAELLQTLKSYNVKFVSEIPYTLEKHFKQVLFDKKEAEKNVQ